MRKLLSLEKQHTEGLKFDLITKMPLNFTA